jgi:hypothetical protein
VKYLFVLGLLTFVVFLVYWRLRPYIAVARRVLGFVRDARGLGPDAATNAPRRATTRAGESLVRCAACDTWLPASRALTLRHSATAYCSNACLERAADASQPRRKSAS